MLTGMARTHALFVLSALVFFAGTAMADDKPANVAGTWNVAVTGAAGATNQTIVLQQDGSNLTGTFKGPRESGTITGTVTGNNIKFHVKARIPIDYTGVADGQSMKGTLVGHGKTGDWVATRGN